MCSDYQTLQINLDIQTDIGFLIIKKTVFPYSSNGIQLQR